MLVVDNGRDDEVREACARLGAGYLRPERNLGFARAVNMALASGSGRDVLLVNPDARVSPGLPRRLQAELEGDPRLAVVAPSLVDGTGALQQSWWPVPSPVQTFVDAVGARRLVRARRRFLVGAVLMLRSEAVADVGNFDERFFLYAEECDWQLRAQRRGWRIRLLASERAVHSGAGSSADPVVREKLFFRAAATFGRKWYGEPGWQVMRAASILGAGLRTLRHVAEPSRRRYYTLLLGIYRHEDDPDDQ